MVRVVRSKTVDFVRLIHLSVRNVQRGSLFTDGRRSVFTRPSNIVRKFMTGNVSNLGVIGAKKVSDLHPINFSVFSTAALPSKTVNTVKTLQNA